MGKVKHLPREVREGGLRVDEKDCVLRGRGSQDMGIHNGDMLDF